MTERRITRRIRGRPSSDGAGVRLTRFIGQPTLDHVDPFLLLDEFRSDRPGDYIGGFPEHPHRGFETVTYMLAGAMRHGDNQGNTGRLTAGSIQWMTAGRGILHSEMPEQEDGLMWGFQLWVNLPAKDKMTAPRYQDIAPEAVPTVSPVPGVSIKVLAGTVEGQRGPIQGVATDPIYLDIQVSPRSAYTLNLPEGYQGFAYVFDGATALVGGMTLERGELGLLSAEGALAIQAGEAPSRMLVVVGRPVNEPVARYGPFVMNTPEEIMQAIRDVQSGQFGAPIEALSEATVVEGSAS